MKATTKAMGMGCPVFPGAHTIRTDIIGDEIAYWNALAREAQERAAEEPEARKQADTRLWQ